MRMRLIGAFALMLPFALPLTSSAQDGVSLAGVIPVPGNPIVSSDITWVDQRTERAYITDRSNNGVDIIDAENNVFVGRVTGMVGVVGPSDGTSQNNGPGPNGVVVTNDKVLWAGDGNATTTVADVDPKSATYLQILGRVDTSDPECDDGASHWCGRDDEIGFDPKDRLILIATNGPSDVNAPHGPVAPYATVISADPPYQILQRFYFPGSAGLEQPLWDGGLRGGRFLLTVPGSLVNNILPSVAIIDPVNLVQEPSIAIDCQQLGFGLASQSITGIALGRRQHILVSACGNGAAQPSLPIILSARSGNVDNIVTQVAGGDQVWFDRGSNHFYVTGMDQTGTTGLQSLGEIDQKTGWLQNVTVVRGKNPTALAENNHVFTLVQITAAIAAGMAPDDSVCAQFGFVGTGCVAVFTPNEEDDGN